MSIALRSVVLSRLRKRVEDIGNGYRQNIGLLGLPGMGKTYLLKRFYSELQTSSQVIPVWIDVDCVLHIEPFASHWISSLLSSATNTRDSFSTMDDLFFSCEEKFPKTVAASKHILKLLHQNKRSLALKELFALSGQLSEESEKKVVLFLDEFQGLSSLAVSDPFALLGKHIMVEKDTLYIVSSSEPDYAREIFHEKLSLLFSNFETLELEPLSPEEMCEDLREVLSSVDIDETTERFIYRITHGIPVYMHCLVRGIQEYFSFFKERPSLSRPVVFNIVMSEVFDSRGHLHSWFHHRIANCGGGVKSDPRAMLTLCAISLGHKKPAAISAFNDQNLAETRRILTRLMGQGLIKKNGSLYQISDAFFAFWVKEVFYPQHMSFDKNPVVLRNAFINTLDNLWELSKMKGQESLVFQFDKLLRSFKNDSVEILGKKTRYPSLREIELKPYQSQKVSIAAKTDKHRWFFRVYFEEVDEDVATAFLTKRAYGKKGIKRILVALKGIDQNAKLFCQQNKITIWDLDYVNQLMCLHDLPKMIIADCFRERKSVAGAPLKSSVINA